MTDEELTYPKKATRKRHLKRGANVAEQEQCKHGKRSPQKQHKNKPVCAASQQATS